MANKQYGMMERKSWIDWAKAFGLYLVVLGHVTNISDYTNQLLYSFHMPLFFVISGYLDHTAHCPDVKRHFSKLFKRLLVPYFVFGFTALVVTTFSSDFNELARNTLRFIMGRSGNFSSPMWFVYTLFEVKMLYVCIIWLTGRIGGKRIISLLVIAVTILILLLLNHLGLKLPWVLNFLVAYPFFIFGTRMKECQIETKRFFRCGIGWILLSLLLPILSVRLNGRVDMLCRDFGNSILLYYLFGITISYCVLLSFKAFLNYSSKVIQCISKGSLLIVAMHMLVINPLSLLKFSIFLNALFCLIVVLAFYPLIIFSISCCPFLIGISKKPSPNV